MAEVGGGSQKNVLRTHGVERRGKEERREFKRKEREKETEGKEGLRTKRGRTEKKQSLIRD